MTRDIPFRTVFSRLAALPVIMLGLLLALAAPAQADQITYDDFKTELSIVRWHVADVEDETWVWLRDNVSNNPEIDELFEDEGDNDDEIEEDNYYFLKVTVIATDSDNEVTGGSLTLPGNVTYPIVVDENGDYLFVSAFETSITDLYDAFPAGDYSVSVVLEDGSSAEGVVSLPNYLEVSFDSPNLDVEFDDEEDVPEYMTLSWESAEVDEYRFAVFTGTGSLTSYLTESVSSAGDAFGAQLYIDNLSYNQDRYYFLSGAVADDADELGVDYAGYTFVSQTFRQYLPDEADGGIDSDEVVGGCAYAPSGGVDLLLPGLLLVCGLWLLRRRV